MNILNNTTQHAQGLTSVLVNTLSEERTTTGQANPGVPQRPVPTQPDESPMPPIPPEQPDVDPLKRENPDRREVEENQPPEKPDVDPLERPAPDTGIEIDPDRQESEIIPDRHQPEPGSDSSSKQRDDRTGLGALFI